MRPANLHLDPEDFRQYTPVDQHSQRAFHATQFALLGGFFGLGMSVRGPNGFSRGWWYGAA